MKTGILIGLAAMFFFFDQAAWCGPSGGWAAGEVSVSGREAISGQLNYDPATDLLQLRTAGGVRVYSARQAGGFQYFDAATNSIRRFVSLSRPDKRFRRAFFEVVLAGELQLLRRLRPQSAARMQAALARTDSPWYDSEQAYSYHVYADSRLVPDRLFYKEMYPRLLAEFPAALGQFMQQKRLDLFTQQGRFLFMHQYNLLRETETMAARRQ